MDIDTAATAYKFNKNYLSLFIHTVLIKGKVIKGENKNFSFISMN